MKEEAYQRNYYQKYKERIKERSRKYYNSHYKRNKKNRERLNTLRRDSYHKTKVEVLLYYGRGKLACVKCGYDDIRALSIDHIKGGGTRERARRGEGYSQVRIYQRLKQLGFPVGYQTLCMNCQLIKRTEEKEYGIKESTIGG